MERTSKIQKMFINFTNGQFVCKKDCTFFLFLVDYNISQLIVLLLVVRK